MLVFDTLFASSGFIIALLTENLNIRLTPPYMAIIWASLQQVELCLGDDGMV